MKVLRAFKSSRLFTAILVVLVVAGLWGVISVTYAEEIPTAPYDLDVGYLDFTFGAGVEADHTASRPQSKVWWNDGFWWASLWNDALLEYHIYRLDWGTQDWQDTGVVVDDRPEAITDVLWDDANQKLYVASHIQKDNPSQVNMDVNWARLYRYSYDEVADSYMLDPGFPVTGINEDVTNTVVIDKDSDGTLWATYVSRPQGPVDEYQVYVNVSQDDGLTWEGSYSLYPDFATEAFVDKDDISSVVAFDGTVGLMWTNQLDGELYFAEYNPALDYDSAAAWTVTAVSELQGEIDDHLSLKADSTGRLFAAVKTTSIAGGEPLIGLVTRDTAGNFAFEVYSQFEDNDTRPILVVDESNNQVYMFVTGKPGGSMICYKSAEITSPLSNMTFPPGDCGELFISDATYDRVDSATASKHSVNDTTGLLVLASDDHNGDVYVHNVIGDPPPVITERSPGPGETGVAPDAIITAQFSKEMDPATVTGGNFTVEGPSGPIAGGVSYDNGTRMATFTPVSPLSAATVYTATITTGVEDMDGTPLYETEEWSFDTGAPLVAFSLDNYSVLENEATATVTVTLSSPASGPASVDYATSGDTATAGTDYTETSGTLNFNAGETSASFTVPIVDDVVDEVNETVNLTLSNPVNASLGTPATAVLTIIDNEGAPTLQFQPTSITVDEGAGTVSVTVSLSPSSLNVVEVDYATSDGSATAGSDYSAHSGTLTFQPGETTKTFAVSIIDDTLNEPSETVNLALSNPTGGAELGDPGSTAVLTILDNDDQVSVSFSASAYDVDEDAGTATITVNLSDASASDVTVNYATGPGTASAGSDYTPTGGTLAFSPGETSKTFTVTILDDALNEPNETVNLTLSSPTNSSLGTPSEAILTIVDDDPMPTVQFSSANYTVDEAAGTATITVVLSAPSGQTTAVDYATSDGTATAGDDYTAASGTLDFGVGETSKTFTITLNDDDDVEGGETVNLTLSNPDDVTLGTPSTATLTINDGSRLYLPIIFGGG